MPVLEQLSISNLRNIEQAKLSLSPSINLFYGDNGSGKTSILEAVYLLGLARSFRTTNSRPLVQYDADELAVFARLEDHQTLGISKNRSGNVKIKINAESATSAASLAQYLPVQLFNSDTFNLLEGGPTIRRRYMDWGVFHVKHQFINHWRQYGKALKQRNTLLRTGGNPEQLLPWSQALVDIGEKIHFTRLEYLDALLPVLKGVLGELLPAYTDDITFAYERGWDKEATLEEALGAGLDRDFSSGHTNYGPHRADLKIRIQGHNAADVLSRGQQKLLVTAMKAAQSKYLDESRNMRTIFLVDDLPAELDSLNRKKVCRLLISLGCQILITSVTREELAPGYWAENDLELREQGSMLAHTELRLFHVKHGKIESYDSTTIESLNR